jgi:hypothetical protein
VPPFLDRGPDRNDSTYGDQSIPSSQVDPFAANIGESKANMPVTLAIKPRNAGLTWRLMRI